MQSHTTVIIPFKERVVFVSLLNCGEFSNRFSEVARALDTISGIEFLAGSGGLGGGGFLARSASGVAPGYERAVAELWAGRIWVISLISFRRAVGYAAVFVVISHLLDPLTIGFERMVPLVQTARF
jgi:hypothetical protein